MKTFTPKFRGKFNGDKFFPINKEGYLNWIKKFDGKEVEVVIKEFKKDRSLQQNAYYWGVIVKMITQETGEEGVHEFLADKFLKVWYMFKGKAFEVVRSTTDLNTVEFNEYIDKCQKFAATELDLYIPDPNEVDYDSIIF